MATVTVAMVDYTVEQGQPAHGVVTVVNAGGAITANVHLTAQAASIPINVSPIPPFAVGAGATVRRPFTLMDFGSRTSEAYTIQLTAMGDFSDGSTSTYTAPTMIAMRVAGTDPNQGAKFNSAYNSAALAAMRL